MRNIANVNCDLCKTMEQNGLRMEGNVLFKINC